MSQFYLNFVIHGRNDGRKDGGEFIGPPTKAEVQYMLSLA